MEPASTEPALVEPGHGVLRGTTAEPASAELRLRVQLRVLQALRLLRVQLRVLQALHLLRVQLRVLQAACVRAPCPTSRPAGDMRLPRPVRTLQALSLLRVQLCVLQALSQNRSGGMPQPRPNSDGAHYNIWERPNSMPSCHCGPFAASGAIGTPAPQATCARSAWPRAPSVRRTHGARDVLSHLSSLQRIE